MQPLPHQYSVAADGSGVGPITIAADNVPTLRAASARELDGPGDQWSPQALLMAATASCYILEFRALAQASKLEWKRIECTVIGTLERVDGVVRFSRAETHVKLLVSGAASDELCKRVLQRAERGCLIANSLRAKRELHAEILRAAA